MSGGVVLALDSAGYGAINIGQSVSLIAPEGVYAGIAGPAAGQAVTVAGTTATDVITLRGLTIEGSGLAANGIYFVFDSIGALHIERCSVSGFTNSAVLLSPGNIGLVAKLYLTDTTLSDSATGFHIVGVSGSAARVMIDHCRAMNNATGFDLQQVIGTVTGSVVTGNSAIGISVSYGDIDGGRITVDHCLISENGAGIQVSINGIVRVANSTIVNNTTGLENFAPPFNGFILTRIGDGVSQTKTNTLEQNGTPGAFTGTYTAQ